MKIRLQSIFDVFGLDLDETFGGNEVDLDIEKLTLRTFLEELTQQSGGLVKLIDSETGGIAESYFILVNGQGSQSLAHGLESELKDGDEVGIGIVDLNFSGG